MISNTNERQVSLLVIGLLIFMNFTGLNITILEPDGALYAGIAKHMAQHNDYWNLFADGHDWLDKPHFPFWMAALSFEVFGYTTAAYKLPAILFLLMGALYTYLFARHLYNEKTARWAVCILLTAEHLVISNNDVRAEPYLTGLIIAGVYHLYRSQRSIFNYHVVLGALFTACAIMTKGPFALVPVGGAIAGHLVFTRQWKQLLHVRWLLAALLIAVFITPELYALYQQFDMHPEKVVFGRTGVSGIRFFFWDSQFGRFMNTGPIKGSGDPFFFFHTVLWAFLPWSILLYAAVIVFIKKRRLATEYYCISGALLTFALFSLSRFQLPHYLNIIFPFFAILTAQYILSLSSAKGLQFYRVTQYTIMVIVAVAIVGLSVLYQPVLNYYALFCMLLGLLLFLLLPRWLESGTGALVFFRTCAASLVLNIFLNLVMYPDMMRYQSGSTVARYVNVRFPGVPVSFWKAHSYALEFYLDAPVRRYDNTSLRQAVAAEPVLLYTTPEHTDTLQQQGYNCQVIKEFPQFYISKLDLPFVNHATRSSALQRRWLVWVQPGKTAWAGK
ncbi:ArnT family glycosyltransferase [Chitinophaga japonensis]|uniref:4-amino-4-deoxy-L-arabinose transferase-like glycosyltransferase n=1 Tax=Chitinophaga japonensis TaxID=104662 RepID=A0A562TEN7_CHIJA|nr:glycosyltransferase family 39 protein [Chitinophaga japonensis]TWI91566.1 4-amino-4-deoxy-L-arabinose transferase-like glycosyltransferase [Chitinophaga japonensis]